MCTGEFRGTAYVLHIYGMQVMATVASGLHCNSKPLRVSIALKNMKPSGTTRGIPLPTEHTLCFLASAAHTMDVLRPGLGDHSPQ